MPWFRLATVVVLLLSGCQQTAVPERPQPPPSPGSTSLKEQGDELTARKEWAAAVAKYQAALNEAPGDVALRLALGTALSHLDRREETVDQFRWILDHAKVGSSELVVARSWLAGAGELTQAGAVSVPAKAEENAPLRGSVKGITEWPGVNPRERLVQIRVVLEGEDDAAGFEITTRLGQGYEFRSVPPGKYRLRVHARDADVELWNQVVSVEAGKETVVNLTSSMSPVSPKDFPSAIISKLELTPIQLSRFKALCGLSAVPCGTLWRTRALDGQSDQAGDVSSVLRNAAQAF